MRFKRKIDAFGAFRPFLRLLTIFDLANFRHSDRRVVLRNIFRAIVCAIIILCHEFLIMSNGWFCISHHFILREVAFKFGLYINATQFAITFVAFRWKIRMIYDTIDDLNGIVNMRKC